MKEVFGMFQMITSNSEYLDVYLSALHEHQGFRGENSSVVQTISSLLTKPNRKLGLQILSSFLEQCSIEILEQKVNLWNTLSLKACNTRELQSYGEIVFHVLAQLASKVHQLPDLVKSFSSSHLTKIYEALSKAPTSCHPEALQCVEICLRLYPGSSGISRGSIERFLMRFIDTQDEDINLKVAKCYHLLLQVRGGGVDNLNHKAKWQTYQLQLLGSIHSLLDEAFAKSPEHYDDPTETKQLLSISGLELSDEPVKRVAQLYVRLHNLIVYLETALREPFPVEKPFMPKKILNLIIRGLSMTCPILQQHPISDNLALCILLPKMHYHLLQLLETLIQTLRTHLIIHHQIILGTLCDILKWSANPSTGQKKAFSNLRLKTYQLISLWCAILQSGSRCELIADFLVQEILNDVFPHQSEFTLQVQAGARKFLSKKARRQLHKAQNERSNLTQVHSSGSSIRKDNFSDEGNQELCIAALRCLQQLLQSSSCLIKPTVVKAIYRKILQICGLFYELPLKRQQLYHNYVCRLEIYNVLCTFIMTPHSLCPPPTELVLSILRNACMRDDAVKVRANCAKILQNLEKIAHTQKEGLLYTIDMRDIANAFRKYGEERLLGEYFNSISVENDDDDDEEQCANDIHISTEISKKHDKLRESIDKDLSEKGSQNEIECETPNATVNTLKKFAGEEPLPADIQPSRIYDDNVEKQDEPNCNSHSSNDNHSTYNDEPLILMEPEQKKLKLANNCKMSTIEKSHIKTADLDEHLLLADIEATFVDELNV